MFLAKACKLPVYLSLNLIGGNQDINNSSFTLNCPQNDLFAQKVIQKTIDLIKNNPEIQR